VKISLYVRQEQIAAFVEQVDRQRVVAEALPGLLAEIRGIDVQEEPQAAAEAAQRLFQLCGSVLESTSEVENSVYLLRQIAASSLKVSEEVAIEMKRRAAPIPCETRLSRSRRQRDGPTSCPTNG
jgi:hypothetical protein